MVEGPTEQAVVNRVFNPYLSPKGIYLYPRIVGKPGQKGGNRFSVVFKELLALLKQEMRSVVTTMFDFYGLSGDWPGRKEAGETVDITRKSTHIESALMEKVKVTMGDDFNPARFIPYVQMHELEALLFADTSVMANSFEKPDLHKDFERIVQECGGCEEIDDNPHSAPSKRIEAICPSYKKGSSDIVHAYRILEKIGIEAVRQKCPHFHLWLEKLENLAGAES